MRIVVASMALLLLAGCMQPDGDGAKAATPIEITIRVVRSQDAGFGAQHVPAGSPAPDGVIGFHYTWSAEKLEERKGREATPVDPDCTVTSNFSPDCSAWQWRESYRVPRDLDGSVNILDITDTAYPVDDASQVRLVFPDPAEVSFRLLGPASDHYPIITEEANGGQGCSQYRAEDVRVIAGDARVTSTDTSAPQLEFWGPATVELGWSAFPSDCGTVNS